MLLASLFGDDWRWRYWVLRCFGLPILLAVMIVFEYDGWSYRSCLMSEWRLVLFLPINDDVGRDGGRVERQIRTNSITLNQVRKIRTRLWRWFFPFSNVIDIM